MSATPTGWKSTAAGVLAWAGAKFGLGADESKAQVDDEEQQSLNTHHLEQRSSGILLGAAVGDALGAAFEGCSSSAVHANASALQLPHGGPLEMVDARLFPDAIASAHAAGLDLMTAKSDDTGTYTDDTECTLSLAESLILCQGLHARHASLSMAFWFLRPPYRGGYSSYTFEKLCALARGSSLAEAGAMHNDKLQGNAGKGSWGNGGAMRIAPLGFVYRHLWNRSSQMRVLVEEALCATHTHEEAIDAALVIALAVARLCQMPDDAVVEPETFLKELSAATHCKELRDRLDALVTSFRHTEAGTSHASPSDDSKLALPKGDTLYFSAADKEFLQRVCTQGKWFQIRAIDAVTYVLYVLAKYGGIDRARHAKSGEAAEMCLVRMVALGGDTDTLACMLGACLGALHGSQWIPTRWTQLMEQDVEYGIPKIAKLSKALAAVSPREPSSDHNQQCDAMCDALVQRLKNMPLHKRHDL